MTDDKMVQVFDVPVTVYDGTLEVGRADGFSIEIERETENLTVDGRVVRQVRSGRETVSVVLRDFRQRREEVANADLTPKERTVAEAVYNVVSGFTWNDAKRAAKAMSSLGLLKEPVIRKRPSRV